MFLKGRVGDQLNALGAALGLNFRKLLAGLQRDAACAVLVAWWQRRITRNIMSRRPQSTMFAT